MSLLSLHWLLFVDGMVRSGHSVYRACSEQAVVAHACHGHRKEGSVLFNDTTHLIYGYIASDIW